RLAPPHAGAARTESPFLHGPTRPERALYAPRQRPRRGRITHDPVHGWPPRALPHPHCPPRPQPLHQLPRLAGREHAPLGRREPAARDTLHLPEGGPEPH